MQTQHATIFTDGSSLGNPGPGGWGFVMVYENNEVVYAKEGNGYSEMTTNNIMELTAAKEAVLEAERIGLDVPLLIYTDSAYLLNGITSWVFAWERNNWITSTKEEVLNKKLWQELIAAVRSYQVRNKIVWKKIKGHAGILGNERCDALATSAAAKEEVQLFNGTYEIYKQRYGDILVIPKVAERVKKERKTGKPYVYLSCVNGAISRHATWAECEARVKGTKGAKYKKAMSKEEESEIVSGWKV